MAKKPKGAPTLLFDGEYYIDVEISDDLDNDTHGTYTKPSSAERACIGLDGMLCPFDLDWTIIHEINHHITETTAIRWSHEDLDTHSRVMARLLLHSPRLIEYLYDRTHPAQK